MLENPRTTSTLWCVILMLMPAFGAIATELPTAEDLVASSIEYHDPQGRFLSQAHRLSFRETRPDRPDRIRDVLIDAPGERFEIRRTDPEIVGVLDAGRCDWTLEGRPESELTDSERAKNGLKCDRLHFMRDYYTYLWGLPMKLRDPGTQLGRVTATEFEGRSVFDLRVAYAKEEGEEVWYFYFDPESNALVGYRFYHDETKNDGEVIYLKGEFQALGMRLPEARTWVTHADGKTLGTDILRSLVAAN